MLSIALSASAIALAAALTVALWRVVPVVRHQIEPTAPVGHPAPTVPTVDPMFELTGRVDALTVAVSEGIAGYQRHEKRIQKTVTSARKLVRDSGLEHAGIEAEYAELQSRDDDQDGPLPALPEEVEATRTVRIPGGYLEIAG